MMKKAVCLISGGLDSSVTAYTAKNEGYELFAITFNYKQKHRREIESAKRIAESVGVKKHILFDIDLSVFGGSSLVDEKTTN